MRNSPSGGGQTLGGRYRVVLTLGSGGMASVYLAEDERLGRLVAVKRLHSSSPDDALARFRREARLGASLNHPNVVSIYDSTADEDSLLIVMEYVKGESLKEQLRRGPLPPERVGEVVAQIGAALEYAHATGVIHRDVKPSNMLIAGDGTAKLADLGIATAVDATSITATSDIIGTLAYIAPERLESAPDAPAADVYSLAAVAFEALSGQKAQPGQTPSEIVRGGARQVREAWPQAPPAAVAVLEEGLARDPSRRPGAGELAERLSTALHGSAVGPTDPEATLAIAAPNPPLTTEEAPAAVEESDMPPAAHEPVASPPAEERDPGRAAGRSGSKRRRTVAVLIAAAVGVVGALFAIAALGGDSEDPRPAGAQSQVESDNAQPEPAPEAEPAEPAPEPVSEPDGEALNAEGFALIQEGNYEEAVAVLQQAVDSFPAGTTELTYAYALYNLGHALRLAGQPEEAIPILEQRLEIPNQTDLVAEELALAQQDAGLESSGGVTSDDEEASGGGVSPGSSGSSGGVKPGNGPKPGKGPDDGGDD